MSGVQGPVLLVKEEKVFTRLFMFRSNMGIVLVSLRIADRYGCIPYTERTALVASATDITIAQVSAGTGIVINVANALEYGNQIAK